MTRLEEFLKEKQYITNVSPRTLEWYQQALRWLPDPDPTEADLKQTVIRVREASLSARSVNSYRTALNAYLHWINSPHRIPRMKQEEKILPTYSPTDISAFLRYKPTRQCERRLQVLVLMMADTGTRISELLGLRWEDVPFDDLLVTVKGKGDKQRMIPFSWS